MSDDEPPTRSDTGPGVRDGSETGGKLISADVFMARLAGRRQAERAPAPEDTGSPSVLVSLLSALESLGLDPTRISPAIARMAQAYQADSLPSPDPAMPNLEDLGMIQALMDELEARPDQPTQADSGAMADDMDWTDGARRNALIHLAERLNPEELSGRGATPARPPTEEAALADGMAEGAQRALREITRAGAPRKRRSPAKRVADPPATYDATSPKDPPAPDQ